MATKRKVRKFGAGGDLPAPKKRDILTDAAIGKAVGKVKDAQDASDFVYKYRTSPVGRMSTTPPGEVQAQKVLEQATKDMLSSRDDAVASAKVEDDYDKRYTNPDGTLKRRVQRQMGFAAENAPGIRKTKPVVKKARGGGIESKGKTQGKTVKMARGGGVESKGKTKGRFV